MAGRRHTFRRAILVLAFSATAARSQEPVSTPGSGAAASDTLLKRNRASVLFERNLNTFNWAGSLFVDTAAVGLRMRLENLLLSNIILVDATAGTPEQRLQSTQHRLRLRLTRPLTNGLSATGQWSSLSYSDEKAVGLSTASINNVLAGVEYSPVPLLTLVPMIGHRWDNQIDVRDRGLSYTLFARTSPIDVDGFRLVDSAQFQQDRLGPRVLEQHYARIGLEKWFLGRTRDSLDAGYVRSRREFYTSQSGALESRIENILTFSNLLEYEFDQNLLASVFLGVFGRSLDKDYRALQPFVRAPAQFNTGIEEFQLQTFAQGMYRNDGGVELTARFAHSERNERHFVKSRASGFLQDTMQAPLTDRQAQEQEQTKDNLTRRTSLAGTIRLPLSMSDTVSLAGGASILRYDTPSAANVEDRDELLVALSLSSTHQINRYLNVSLLLEGTVNHIVYLLKDRSANNNVNRVLRFAPSTLFTPFDFLSSLNTFEVLANYTVYDFEAQAAQVRSFSYRQFGWRDSTTLSLSNRLALDFFLYLKLYERGQLNWREFSERRENSFVDRTYAAQVRFSPEPGLLFAVGLRYFSQTRYSYSGERRKLDSFLRSIGPTCLIVYDVNASSEVTMKGWYEHRRLEGGGSRSLANMTLTVTLTI